MNPDLVTNESQNKRTPQPQPKSPTVCKNLNIKGKREMKSPQCQLEISDDESQEEEDFIRYFSTPKESMCIADIDSCIPSNNESTLDPETGLILDTSTNTGPSSLSALSTSSSTETETAGQVIISSVTSTEIETLGQVIASPATSTVLNTTQYNNTTIMSNLMENCPTPTYLRQSVIQGNLFSSDYYSRIENLPNTESDSEENGRYTIIFLSSNIYILFMYKSDEDSLLQYLHKKFDRQGPSNLKRKYPDQNGTSSFGIKKVSIFPQKDVYANKR